MKFPAPPPTVPKFAAMAFVSNGRKAPPPAMVGAGLAGWMAVEAALGAVQTARQTTAGLHALGLYWPGTITPEMLGASVVQTASGLRWLRAYGTLPHPNI